MRKFILTLVILFIAAAGPMAWAQPAHTQEKPKWVIDREKKQEALHPGRGSKLPRKTGGTAKWGAKQVSPLVVRKHK